MFHGFIPEKNAFMVCVVMFFKTALGQLHALGWITLRGQRQAAGQKAKCDEFMDGTVQTLQRSFGIDLDQSKALDQHFLGARI
jgi:hypothetical protein